MACLRLPMFELCLWLPMFSLLAKFSYPAHIGYITTGLQQLTPTAWEGRLGDAVLCSFSTVLTLESLDSGTENVGSASPQGSEKPYFTGQGEQEACWRGLEFPCLGL